MIEPGSTVQDNATNRTPFRDRQFWRFPTIGDLKTQYCTIEEMECDLVIVGTPIDLSRLVKIDKPVVRARYELQEVGRPDLADALAPLLKHFTSTPRVPAAR